MAIVRRCSFLVAWLFVVWCLLNVGWWLVVVVCCLRFDACSVVCRLALIGCCSLFVGRCVIYVV